MLIPMKKIRSKKKFEIDYNPIVLLLSFIITLLLYYSNSGSQALVSRESFIGINGFIIPIIFTIYTFFLSTTETRLYLEIKRSKKSEPKIFQTFLEPILYSFIAISFSVFTNGVLIFSSILTYYAAIFFTFWSLLQSILLMKYISDIHLCVSAQIDELRKKH